MLSGFRVTMAWCLLMCQVWMKLPPDMNGNCECKQSQPRKDSFILDVNQSP